jgi:ligand-binding SRPBCC domain-containing protein
VGLRPSLNWSHTLRTADENNQTLLAAVQIRTETAKGKTKARLRMFVFLLLQFLFPQK